MASGFILYLFSGKEQQRFDGRILRNAPGEASEEYMIDVQCGEEMFEGIKISVKPGQYSQKQCEKIFEQSRECILRKMLGENANLGQITQDLVFFDKMEDCPFSFSWMIDRSGLIDDEGRILCEKPFDVVVTYKVNYMSFSKDCSIPVHVDPSEEIVLRIKRERMICTINDTLNQNAMIPNESTAYLPTDLDGSNLAYYYSGTKRNPFIILGGLISGLFIWIAYLRDERKNEERMKNQMLKEYPNILQRMSLYLVTGMPIRMIWSRICEAAKNKQGSYIYELMKESGNELQNGVSEELVLSRFAEKTKTSEYIRFSALITQNRKRGSTSLRESLKEETMKAFLQKKQNAIRNGEKAGMKLLIPMMILLVDVMIMIIVPALWNV